MMYRRRFAARDLEAVETADREARLKRRTVETAGGGELEFFGSGRPPEHLSGGRPDPYL